MYYFSLPEKKKKTSQESSSGRWWRVSVIICPKKHMRSKKQTMSHEKKTQLQKSQRIKAWLVHKGLTLLEAISESQEPRVVPLILIISQPMSQVEAWMVKRNPAVATVKVGIECNTSTTWMSQELSKRFGSVGYFIPIHPPFKTRWNNPFTYHLLSSWDILIRIFTTLKMLRILRF